MSSPFPTKIVAEYAKSGKSSCRQCSEKIDSKSLRLGLKIWGPRGYDDGARWHHVNCFSSLDPVPVSSVETIEGFSELADDDQDKLKKMMSEVDQSSAKREGDDPTDSEPRDSKKLKTDEDKETGQEKNVTKEKIVAEYAKSGKSSCRKCSENIESKSLRLGWSSWDRRGFEHRKWHHLECFFTVNKDTVSPETIEGFLELKSSDQEKLKKLAAEGVQTSKKTDEDEETRQEKKNITKEKIVAEYAKSGKYSCKKCSEKIESKSLRLGLRSWDPRGFEHREWHHLECFFTVNKDTVSPETIEWFFELKSNDQEKLKRLAAEGGQSSKKREGDDPTDSEPRDLKKLKTDEDKETGQEKNVTKEKIVAEYAKSGKSSCRKCSENIESKSLRLGWSSWDRRGFEHRKWHHLECFFTVNKDTVSPETIEGFLELKSSDQEKLKKLAAEGGQTSKEREGDNLTESELRDSKKLKTDEDEETGQEKTNVTNEMSSDHKVLKNLVTEGGHQSSKKREGDNPTESELRDSKKLKTDEDEGTGQEKKNVRKEKTDEDEGTGQEKKNVRKEKTDEDEGTGQEKKNVRKEKTDEDEGIGQEKKNVRKEKTDEDEGTGQVKKNVRKEKIVAEYAKSGKSSCRKCSENIESKSLRLGWSSWDRRGFEHRKWHHLECFFAVNKDTVSPETIEGFLELKSHDQEKLKKLVIEGDQSSKKTIRLKFFTPEGDFEV